MDHLDIQAEDSDLLNGAAIAPQACSTCRKQKRKCDKQLPACSLCQRIGRECDYTVETAGGQPTSEEFAALRQKVSELEQILSRKSTSSSFSGPSTNGSSNGFNEYSNGFNVSSASSVSPPSSSSRSWSSNASFPTLFFLDSNAFVYDRFQVQAPYVKVPPGALSALGSSIELRSMIEQYFTTVHNFLPIVSKIRLYQQLSNPLHEPGADFALLFLAMKLLLSEPPESQPPQTQLYQDVKSFLTYVESQNGFSIQMIQSVVLVSLYEVGHAIYPAAYLSIGHAARLGQAAGIHQREAPQMLSRPATWTEYEERRRVWWAVLILDRFVNIGHRDKPFASSDPSLDAHLPTDDAHWDRGQMLVAAPLALSASLSVKAAPYARMCQAAHLLGKVIRNINDRNVPAEYKFSEAKQVNRTTCTFANILYDEASGMDGTGLGEEKAPLCTTLAVLYSGLLTLYDAYSCPEHFGVGEDSGEWQLEMQKEAIEGLKEWTLKVVHLARHMKDQIQGSGFGTISPMMIDCLYQAAANYAWYVRESSDRECMSYVQELKELLLLLDKRWRVAGEYYRIIEATEYRLATQQR